MCGLDVMDRFIHSGLQWCIDYHYCVVYAVKEAEDIVAIVALGCDKLELDSTDKEELQMGFFPKPDIDYNYQQTFWAKSSYPAIEITYLAVRKDKRHLGIGDIIDRLDATLGVSLPSEYMSNIRGNEKMQRVIKSKIGSEYTEGFIKEQMNSSWGINNQNQLIFVWSAVYKQITDEDLYDGSDGDDNRVDDFAEVVDRWEACGNKYAEGFNKYMEQKSAEAERRSAEYDKEITKKTSSRLENLVKFYSLYKKDPKTVYPDEIARMKVSAKEIVQDCKEYNIDYKKELTPEMLKFYGIE